MPQDKWEQLLPDNFATLDSAGRSMEMMGVHFPEEPPRGTKQERAGPPSPAVPEESKFRRHAGSLGVSEDAAESGEGREGGVQRRRAKAVHSQFAMADSGSVGGLQAGSIAASVSGNMRAAMAAQQRHAGARQSGGGRGGSFTGGRRATDTVDRSVGSLPHIQTQLATWHGRRPTPSRLPSDFRPGTLSPSRRNLAATVDSGHGSTGAGRSRAGLGRLVGASDSGVAFGMSRRGTDADGAATASVGMTAAGTARDSVERRPSSLGRPTTVIRVLPEGVTEVPEGEAAGEGERKERQDGSSNRGAAGAQGRPGSKVGLGSERHGQGSHGDGGGTDRRARAPQKAKEGVVRRLFHFFRRKKVGSST